jgi:hypothetical protein
LFYKNSAHGAKGDFFMQEDVERRTVAISVSAAKLTGRTLAKAVKMICDKMQEEHRAGQTPHGKQSLKKLMNHGVATNSLPLDGDTKLFDRIARKYNVDYAFHKVGKGKYLLFFKAGQADAITACFSKYSKFVLEKGVKRPSILAQLKKALDYIKSLPQRERAREDGRDER